MSVTTRGTNRVSGEKILWGVQGVLALLFLFAGGMKLLTPTAALAKMMPFPVPFLRFIGGVEICGALGLILPGLLAIRPALTSLAAAGLVIIMVGATGVTLASGGGATALIPAVTGSLAGFVAYRRRQRGAFRPSYRPTVHPAAH